MYKLLLVSDREDVLAAFDQVDNWGFNGFKKPHVRHDVEGAKEGLQKHHVDGIAFALDDRQEEELIAFLREEYPTTPILEVGTTPAEVQVSLNGLLRLLNHLRADFASDTMDAGEKLILARRHLFRSLLGGRKLSRRQLWRDMQLLRSRMDPDQPCVIMRLEAADPEEKLAYLWQDNGHLMERDLYRSFGGDLGGMHVLPLVPENGEVWVLAGTLRGQNQQEDVTKMLWEYVQDGLQHAKEYQDLHLRIGQVEVFPSLYALCTDFQQ